MEKEFDLTTAEGRNAAQKFVLLTMPGGLYIYLLKEGIEIVKKIFSSDATKEQGKMAKTLIEAGKNSGASEMEITLNNTKGFDLSAPIEGVDIRTTLGSKEQTIIKVKYK